MATTLYLQVGHSPNIIIVVIRKTKPILLVLLLALAPLFISHPAYAITEQTADVSPTPTPSAEPSPTPDVTPTPEPTPEPTEKDIPVSESNPSWLLELEKQFYASRLAVVSTPPTAPATRYYRQLPITPTPSPTPQLVQNNTQVKGLLSATASKKPEQKKDSRPNIGIVALVSITVSLAAIITNFVLKPKTTG